MTTFNNVFGSSTLPPSQYGYQALALTADTTTVWPYNSTGGTVVSKIMDVTASAAYALTIPDATLVSTGEDFLVRNVGSFSVTVKSTGGATIGTVASGAASYFYLTNNTTSAGIWGLIAYGVGTSSVDAASLVGYGIMASGTSLNQSHPIYSTATPFTIDATMRAQMINYTGGVGTLALTSASTLGNNYFTIIRNSGTGTLTIDPAGAELIDGQSQDTLQPGESFIIFCSGAAWWSVGIGRSIQYNFTQLVLDVSAAGSFTLTSTQAANKLITFTGNPASAVTVIVPSVVSVYYLQSSISTSQNVTVKTSAGTGVVVTQTSRTVAICDATNVVSAQSIASNTSVSLVDGTAATPALFYASQTNTGIFKYSTTGFGITAAGVEIAHFDPTAGAQISVDTKINSTGALQISAGTTAQRPANGAGKIRYNSDYARGELNDGTNWKGLGGASGAGGDAVFYLDDQTVAHDFGTAGGDANWPTTQNAGTFGPTVVAVGVTVTVPTGSTWTIV